MPPTGRPRMLRRGRPVRAGEISQDLRPNQRHPTGSSGGLAALVISAGLLDRILISQDVGDLVTLSRYGGYGRTHLLKNLAPMFNHYGITADHLHTIMVENPKRLFPIQQVSG